MSDEIPEAELVKEETKKVSLPLIKKEKEKKIILKNGIIKHYIIK